MPRRPLPPLLLLLALAACGGGPRSPFVRVTSDSGRIYYTRSDRALHSSTSDGFLTFRDLVTGEQVRLADGSYTALEVPRGEVAMRQDEYLADRDNVPRADPGGPDPRAAE